MISSECWSVLSLLVLLTGSAAFKITKGLSVDHLEITETALLDATLRACRSLADAEGREFVPPVSGLLI